MHKVIRKKAGPKIAVLAGMPSSDYKGRRLLEILQLLIPNTGFFGVGGPRMQAFEGFENYGSLDKIKDKPFYPHFNYDADPRLIINPPLLSSNIHNARLLSEIKKRNFWKNFEREAAKDVDMVFTVGNELLSHRIFEKVNQRYTKMNELKPITIHVDATHRGCHFDHLQDLDFYVYTLPLRSTHLESFDYPGQFIGKQVVFDALTFLYGQSARFQNRLGENTIDLSQQVNVLATEEIAFQMRQEFRERHFIPESSHVIFLSPGSEESEIRGNLKVAADAVDVFVRKFTKDNRFSRKNFAVVINLPENQKSLSSLTSLFSGTDVLTRVIVGNQNGERYRAMAASDLGAAANGDSVLECAAFQLPTVVLDNSTWLDAYLKMMYNTRCAEFNWVANGEVFPETIGWHFGSKVAEFWEGWFVSPKERYRLAQRANKFLLALLPKRQTDFPIDVLAASEEHSFETYYNPELVLANFIGNLHKNFTDIKRQGIMIHEKILRRKALILGADNV